MTPYFRVYTNTDVVGVELGGAVKNVIALAVGMAKGMGMGDNSQASIITRGLAEITRLGLALGADAATFAGLAGVGDLVATCISTQSRNRYVGEQLGKGRTIDEIVAEMKMVAEGIKTCRVVLELADRYGVDGLHTAMREVCDYSERRVRAAIADMPDGTWSASDVLELDDDVTIASATSALVSETREIGAPTSMTIDRPAPRPTWTAAIAAPEATATVVADVLANPLDTMLTDALKLIGLAA